MKNGMHNNRKAVSINPLLHVTVPPGLTLNRFIQSSSEMFEFQICATASNMERSFEMANLFTPKTTVSIRSRHSTISSSIMQWPMIW